MKKSLHILNRLSFGLSPGDIEQIQSIGIDAYIQSQLSPESIPESPQITRQLDQWRTLKLTPVQLLRQYKPRHKEQRSEEERQKARQKARQPLQQAIQARLLRAIASRRQLQEVMVDFWFNHFNLFVKKGEVQFWVGVYEQQAIRPYALGRFRELLAATVHHPAMLVYLDNWLNTAPNSPGAKGKFRGINENYARELMELHTLGVDGGYTQDDVIALAHILTGWGLDLDGNKGNSNGFYFDSNRHDYSDKVLLGQRIKGNGVAEVEEAIDSLASHPATARYISYKLAQYFVADEPPSGLVKGLAQEFLQTEGDIRAVLETLFQSPEFLQANNYGRKFKTPYHYIISAVRATGTKEPNLQRISGMLNQLSMPLYNCATPEGYKNTQEAWLSPDGMLRRVSLATTIAQGGLGDNKSVDASQLLNTLGNSISAQTKQEIEKSPETLRAALILGSPDLMYR